MPAKSKAQQKLFSIVHAYQMGKIPADRLDPRIIKIAQQISPEDAKKYATELQEDIPNALHEIIKNNSPQQIKGTLIDKYTASLLLTVFNKLNEDNKQKFLQKTINEMVAISYKILTD